MGTGRAMEKEAAMALRETILMIIEKRPQGMIMVATEREVMITQTPPGTGRVKEGVMTTVTPLREKEMTMATHRGRGTETTMVTLPETITGTPPEMESVTITGTLQETTTVMAQGMGNVTIMGIRQGKGTEMIMGSRQGKGNVMIMVTPRVMKGMITESQKGRESLVGSTATLSV